jgi:hypothetical protein
MAYCTKCGEPLRNNVKFCTACGAAVRANKEISAPTQPRNQQRQKPKAKQTQPSVHPQPPLASENQTGLKARAIAKGLSRSLALSVVVLGPGLLLLQAGATVLGMLWLFAGSFGMMAWTYRRPWRFSRFGCLIPPIAAGLSYVLQLTLFNRSLPPAVLVILGLLAGAIVGFFRGKAHRFFVEQGELHVQKTLGYLIAWVVTYALTQLFGLYAANILAVQAGLVAGAVTTAMLTTVSISLLIQGARSRQRLSGVVTRALPWLLIPAIAILLYPSQPQARSFEQMASEILDDAVNPGEFPYLGCNLVAKYKTGSLRTFECAASDIATEAASTAAIFLAENSDSEAWLKKKKQTALQDIGPDGYATDIDRHTFDALSFERISPPFYGGNEAAQGYLGSTVLYIAFKSWVVEIGFSHSFRDKPYLNVSTARSVAKRIAHRIVARLSKLDLSGSQTTSPRANYGGVSGGAGRGGGDGIIQNRLPTSSETAELTAVISVIMVLAGIGANLANSIAAALAQALQAGAELTGSEIDQALSKAMDQSKKDAVKAPIKPDRPPGPTLYDQQGKPFERNDLGQYWAPNERGDWAWLDEGQAREASQALRDEQEIRKAEQQFHDEETDRLLDKARREHALGEVHEALRRQAGAQNGDQSATGATPDVTDSLPEETAPGEATSTSEDGAISSNRERLASDTEQSEKEAGQLLGDLLEEDPEQRPPATQPPEAPPAIPAVPTTLSDDRELPQDVDGGAKPAEQPKTREQATPETTAAAHKAATRLNEEEAAGTKAPAEPMESELPDTRLAEAMAEASAEAEALAGDLLGEDAGRESTTDSPPEPADAGSESSADVAEGESARPPLEAPPAPLRDPIDGTPLEVDAEGRVKYGEQWLSPEEAAHRAAMDQEWQRAQASGQERIDRFKATLAELEQTSDPQARQRLEAEIRHQAIEMNGNYAAKTILKAEGRTDAGAAFDQAIHSVYDDVDDRFLGDLNEQGFRRGGREFTRQDVTEFRNAASAGKVGIDRDVGLDERVYREALEALQNAKPGSPEAQEALQRLAQARNQGRLTLDPEQHGHYLADRKGRLIEQAVAKRGQLATMLGQDPEAVKLREELGQLEGQIKEIDQRQNDLAKTVENADALKQARIAELERTRNALPADSPARARIDQRIESLRAQKTIDMSPGRWNEAAQTTYGEAYARTTGRSADEAMQVVTTGKHVEAYQDGKVLRGVSAHNLPDPRFAEQTASVSRIKDIENRHLAEAGHLTQGQAIQETARGYAKDMATKVIPMLESDPKVVPEKLEQIRKMRDVFERAGRGEIPPGRIDGELRKAVPDIEGLTLQKATQIVDGRFQAAIQRQVVPEVPKTDFGAHLSTALDAEGVVNDFNRLRSEGLSVEDAAFVASAKAVVGAKMGEHLNPGISMAGAMLPEGSRKLLPDQFAGELVEEGHKALKGLVKDLAESTVTGEVNLEHFNAAAEKIGDGKGVIGDWAKVARFLGEEAARADQSNPDAGAFGTGLEMMGNLKDDLKRMHQTGALGEQLGEMKQQAEKYLSEDLAREALEGKHGVPLSGYAEAARLAGEILEDPAEFGRDLQRMWQQGGDAELVTEMVQHTDKTLTNTPVAGTVYSGWKHLGDLATKAEKRQEAFEGAQALAGEAYGWFDATSKSVARELHHRLFE